MSPARRLVAVLTTLALACSVLALGLPLAQAAAPIAPQAAPHDPATYYAGTEGLTGATLAARLHTIIDDHTRLSYANLWSALPRTDPDPARSDALIDVYSGTSIPISAQCGSSCGAGTWNREHSWAKSHGEFGESVGPGTDLFHMRPSFANTNSSRGNLDFDNGGSTGVPNCAACRRDSDSFEPRDAIKGDIARGLFYMAVRYDGDDGFADLKMNDRTCNGSGAGNHGKLSTLVAWSLADPPDARERARNDLIDSDFQHNRNPFIDHPEWVRAIYGDGVGLGPACGSTTGSDTLPGGTTAPVNTAPTAAPMTATTDEDATRTVTLVANDPDGDPLTWTITAQPAHGTASLAGASLTYVPTPDFHGTDSVGVTVSDGRGGTTGTTVTLTVTPVNDAPVAYDASATTPRGTSTAVTLAATDVDDTALTYAVASVPAHGSVSIDGDVATYAPAAGYAGPDSFTYVARDPAGAASAPATVSLTVTATPEAPQPPQATAVSAATAEDRPVTFTLTATDRDGGPIAYAVTSPPAHGSVVLDGASATYTPDRDRHGADAFTWSATNTTGTTTATATVDVTPVNDPPTLASTRLVATAGVPTTRALTASDPDGDPVSVVTVSAPTLRTVTHSGLTVTYTSTVRSGADRFTAVVSDGRATASAGVGVEVSPVTARVVVDTPATTVGRLATTTVLVLGDGFSAPTGTVTLRDDSRDLGTAAVGPDGTAVVTWTALARTVVRGRVYASYGGDARYDPVGDWPGAVVVHGLPSVAAWSTGPLRRGRPAVVRLTIRTVTGFVPGGRAEVSVGGATRVVRVVDGVAVIRIKRLPRKPRLRLVADYAGDARYAPVEAVRVLTLRR